MGRTFGTGIRRVMVESCRRARTTETQCSNSPALVGRSALTRPPRARCMRAGEGQTRGAMLRETLPPVTSSAVTPGALTPLARSPNPGCLRAPPPRHYSRARPPWGRVSRVGRCGSAVAWGVPAPLFRGSDHAPGRFERERLRRGGPALIRCEQGNRVGVEGRNAGERLLWRLRGTYVRPCRAVPGRATYARRGGFSFKSADPACLLPRCPNARSNHG